ncbi:hypothetical protein WJX74_010340 [Apatococcus lobatus]|uniref:HNH nuclease domain-containing protein n=1 Tax=Apatococcus lobatus TaxID=904363 RepID=A0AAW1QXB6_9CHLO
MVGAGRVLALTNGLSAHFLARTSQLQARSCPLRCASSKSQRPARSTAAKSSKLKEAAPPLDEDLVEEALMQNLEVAARQSFLNTLNGYRALVLDSSYRPIDVVNWQRAICLDLFEKVDVLEYYDQAIRSSRQEFPLPAVLRVKVYIRKQAKKESITLTRRNLLMRDKHTCQYCGAKGSTTVDHVIPTSKGGAWSWENCVTACMSCNSRKGSKSVKQLGWSLKRTPREPSAWELGLWLAVGALDTSRKHPKEWAGYLFPHEFATSSPETAQA